MGRKLRFEIGRRGEFTLFQLRPPSWAGAFVLVRKRAVGLPNPKREFHFDWNAKLNRLAAGRDVWVLRNYHPDIHAWVLATIIDQCHEWPAGWFDWSAYNAAHAA
jgi:hypothetical protein